MIDYKFDTQLLIDGEDLSKEDVIEYINKNFDGDCLLVVGSDELLKIHYHTNEPWKLLEYGASIGDIYDIVVENMVKQSNSFLPE